MTLRRRHVILLTLHRARTKRRFASELIRRGLNPEGESFFEDISHDGPATIMVGRGRFSLPSQEEIQEKKKEGAVLAYFPRGEAAFSILRYMALTDEEEERVRERCLTALSYIVRSSDEERAIGKKKNKA